MGRTEAQPTPRVAIIRFMRAVSGAAFTFFLVLSCATAQPVIYPRGIASAATYAPFGLPNGPIARGSIFSVFGTGLGPAAPAQVSQFPLQTTFSGVSVTITQGSTQVSAIPIYATAGQLNVLMPSNAPLGAASLRVTYNGTASNASPVQIQNNSFGFFLLSGGTAGPGALLNFIASDNQPFNSLLVSAKPGQVVTAYGTGLGPVAADNVAPTPVSLPFPVQVFVGGQSATVAYSGRSPCCSGLDQIVFTVPASAPSGCWVPVYAMVGGVTSNFATMAIGPNGGACSEPSIADAAGFIKGGKIGTLRLFRTNTHEDIGTRAPLDVTTDHFLYDFAAPASDQFAYASLFSQPPAGTCNVLSGSGDLFGGIVAPPTPAKIPRRLDGGVNFTLTGPRGSLPIAVPAPTPAVQIGRSGPSGLLPNQLYLDPGSYTLQSSGGADVASFSIPLTVAAPFSWTNRDQLSGIDRTQALTLNWSGLAADQTMLILGGNVDLPTNSSALFYCIAPAGASSFTIPASVLAAVPATRSNVLQSKGAIYIGNIAPSDGKPFTAPGLDSALAVTGFLSGKTVTFR